MKVITKTNSSCVTMITESLQVTFDLIDVIIVIGPIFSLTIMKIKMRMRN